MQKDDESDQDKQALTPNTSPLRVCPNDLAYAGPLE